MKKNTKKVDIIIVAVILLIIAAVVLAVILKPNEKKQSVNDPVGSAAQVNYTDYNGKKIGILTGASFEPITFEAFPDSEYFYYNSYSDLNTSLSQGNIDGFVGDMPTLQNIHKEMPEIGYLSEPITSDDYYFLFNKNDTRTVRICGEFNEFLGKLRDNGTLKTMEDIWFGSDENAKVIDESSITGENGSVKIVTCSSMPPFCYVKDGKISGFCIDLAVRFCREYGYSYAIEDADVTPLLAGITSGKYDFSASPASMTEERRQSMLYSDSFYSAGTGLAVRASDISSDTSGGAVEDRPFSYYADNKKIGVITGGLYEVMIRERYPNADLYQYNNQADLGAALDAGLIDCFTVPRSTAEDFKKQYDGFTYLNEVFTQIPYGFAFEKSADKEYLRDRMNEFLKKIQSDGTYDEIVSVWFGDDEDKKIVDDTGLTGENGSLKMVTTATMQPFSYIKEGKNVGLEIDLVTRFCREYGYSLSIDSAEFASLIPGITSGMYNIAAGNIMITAERAESVNFSDVYYTADAVAVVRNEAQANTSGGITKDTPLSYFSDKRIGILTGSAYEPVAEELFPNAEYVYFDVASDLALATVSGKIDGYLMSVDQAETMKAENPQLFFLNDDAGQTPYAFAFPKTDKGAALRDEINVFLEKIRADGTMDKLLEKWVNGDLEKSVDMTGFTGEKGVLKIASDGTTPPWEYTYNGKLTGYEIELVCMFCRENGYTPSFDTMTFAAVIPAISSEKYDMAAANISVTKERAESVYFSDKESGSKVVFVTTDISAQTGSDGNSSDFFESIAQSFEKNFIREDRWKMILDGIGTTCLITVMSTLFGTILAFLICMFRRTGSALANAISNIYVKLLQGTPMVVLLMILYYVILGKSGLDAVWVAVIGFSLNVGAYVSEIMRSGIESIDGGQREAALALGYSENQAFFRFIFPQAAVRFLPVYKQEIVSLLKSTSIVGYIAIQDLTKMSDIIRSRTYEAFFPLIATAIIYFILAWIISIILKFVLKEVSPKRKRDAAK